MNIIFQNFDINMENISFLETKKNIIMDGNFTKIIYSDIFVTMNGLFINIPLINHIETINNSTRFFINKDITDRELNLYNINDINAFYFHYNCNNLNIINSLSDIENKLLEYYKHFYNVNKTCTYSIYNQLLSGKIKIYKENRHRDHPEKKYKSKIVLKISGIWETMNDIGITYKFLEMYDLL